MKKQVKNELNNEKTTPIETDRYHSNIVLPLVALGLVFVPFIFALLSSLGIHIPMYSLFALLAPMVGFILGIAALQRKERISLAGKIISIIAVALPLAFVAFVIIFFIGAATGLISLM